MSEIKYEAVGTGGGSYRGFTEDRTEILISKSGKYWYVNIGGQWQTAKPTSLTAAKAYAAQKALLYAEAARELAARRELQRKSRGKKAAQHRARMNLRTRQAEKRREGHKRERAARKVNRRR